MMSPRVTQMSPAVCSPKWSRLRSICRSAGDRSPATGRDFLGFVDRFLDLVAQGRLGFFAEDQVAHAPPQARAAVVVAAGRHQAATS